MLVIWEKIPERLELIEIVEDRSAFAKWAPIKCRRVIATGTSEKVLTELINNNLMNWQKIEGILNLWSCFKIEKEKKF